MPDFPIIDAHLHIYSPERLSYPWMDEVPPLRETHDLPRFFRSAAPVAVAGAIFVEVDVARGRHWDEIAYVREAALADDRLLGMVASFPLEEGDGVAAELEAFAALDLASGVRRLIERHHHEPGWCFQDSFVRNVRRLAALGLPFDLCLYHQQLPEVTELVTMCPDVVFILDHLGKPPIRAGAFEPWATHLGELARRPNVFCKLSGVTTEAHHATWTPDDIVPYVDHALACFGVERALYGGDWPVSELAGPYRRWVEVLDTLLRGESREVLEDVYVRTALRLYRTRTGPSEGVV